MVQDELSEAFRQQYTLDENLSMGNEAEEETDADFFGHLLLIDFAV